MKKEKGIYPGILMLAMVLLPALLFAGGSKEVEKRTLTVWDFKYGEIEGAGPVMKELDSQFMEAHPGVIIEHVAQPNDQYNNIVRASVASMAGPDVVMVNGGAAWLKDFSEYIYTLNDDFADSIDEWPESIIAQGSIGNELKSIPLTGQGFGFYYNKALFKEAGLDPDDPPVAWDDFLAACKSLKDAGITPILFPNANMDPSRFTAWTFLSNFYPTDESLEAWRTGKASYLDDPGFKTVLSMLDELRGREYLDPDGASVAYFMDGIEQFKHGEGAMMIGLLSDIAHWKDFSDALGKDNVGYFPTVNYPSSTNGGKQIFSFGIGWSVLENSENKDLAVEYIKHYTRGEGIVYFTGSLGALSPNVKVELGAFAEEYPVFQDIMAYLAEGTVNHYFGYLPSGMRNETIVNYDVLLNARSITTQEAAENLERAYRERLADQE